MCDIDFVQVKSPVIYPGVVSAHGGGSIRLGEGGVVGMEWGPGYVRIEKLVKKGGAGVLVFRIPFANIICVREKMREAENFRQSENSVIEEPFIPIEEGDGPPRLMVDSDAIKKKRGRPRKQ